MKRIYNLLVALVVYISVAAQNAPIDFNTVNVNNIQLVIDTLSSPYFEGRGIETYNKSSDYLSAYFKEIGLASFYDNSYLQCIKPFQYLKFSDSSYLEVNGSRLKIKTDFIHSLFDHERDFNSTESELSAEVFFAGRPDKNIDSVLISADINNKAVIFYPRNGININNVCYRKGVKAILIVHSDQNEYNKMENYAYLYHQVIDAQNYHLHTSDKPTFTTIYLSPKASANLLGVKKGRLAKFEKQYNKIHDSIHYKIPEQIKINIHREKLYKESGNVIGFIQGKDTTGKHIIVSAHYDHLGKKGNNYFPGANDNASGVSSMLEIARVLSNAANSGVKPERSIVFIAFGLEESRILGSKYYVENPVLPLAKLKANINLDMIGRQDKYHDTIPNYIYALGPDSISQGVKELMDSINRVYNFTSLEFLDNFPKAKEFLSNSSDQVNFLKEGIPAVLINNGMHKDLHKPSDTKEKLNYETIESVTQLLLLSVWELANVP